MDGWSGREGTGGERAWSEEGGMSGKEVMGCPKRLIVLATNIATSFLEPVNQKVTDHAD